MPVYARSNGQHKKLDYEQRIHRIPILMDVNTRIKQLREELNRLCHQYYVLNAAPISDADYDARYSELLMLESKYPELVDPSSPTQRVGSPLKNVPTVKHATKMLSLDNAYNAKDVLNFFKDVIGEYMVLEPKIDGASLKLIYERGRFKQAVTRGDGAEGEDVTVAAKTIMTIPMVLPASVDIAVVGEVYMRVSVFNALNEELEQAGEDIFANPRNAAGGSLKLKDPALVAKRKLSFVTYGSPTEIAGTETHYDFIRHLEVLGFQSPAMLPKIEPGSTVFSTLVLDREDALERIIAEADAARKLLDLPTDGLVFKVNNLELQREMGVGNKFPKFACAYKFPPERKATMMHSITVQVGKSGRITPVAELQPVTLSGTTVRRASLCNQDEIDRLGINVGDEVGVEKSAEIIPKVMALAVKHTKGVWKMPTKCPSCETDLARPDGMVDYYCPNNNCDEQVFGRLKHSCGKGALDIDGCGEVMIRELMKHGVRSLSDLFTLEDLKFLKPAARHRLEIGREKAKGAAYWRKLHALGIDGLGSTKSQEVASRWKNLVVALDDPEGFRDVIGKVVYGEICSWFEANIKEFERLEELGLEFQRTGEDGPLLGKVFCITGTLTSGGREAVQNRIVAAGGVVKSGVSKTVNYLVQGLDAGRTKTIAAERHKVSVITEQQLYEMLGEEMPVASTIEEKEY